jgi:TolA-binding protein
MDAVTYPDEKVAEFIERNLIPIRVPFDHQPLSSDFKVTWTPTLVTLDSSGKEHHRTVGFLSPEELIPSLLLGMAKTHFDQNEFEAALSQLEKILKEYPQSGASPEAVYLRGVTQYKKTHSGKPLKEAYEELQKTFPSSEWAKRAAPYRLL